MRVEIYKLENEEPLTLVEADIVRFNTTMLKDALVLQIFARNGEEIQLSGRASVVNLSWGMKVQLNNDARSLMIKIYA